MVSLSCSTKFWAFALAEQLHHAQLLDDFYTTYAYRKNTFLSRFVKRIDNEDIPVEKIHTNTLLAFPIKLFPSKSHVWNNLFDKWVAGDLRRSKSKVFIGWGGMSLDTLRAAKKKNMVTVLERGSSHIVFQDKILREEYKRYGKSFSIHPAVIKKELQEYDTADYIAIPSSFVKKTFIDAGVREDKLWVNPYGFSRYFLPAEFNKNGKFIILYFGTISIRKGLRYLFEALEMPGMPKDGWEAWFIGSIEAEMEEEISRYRHHANWKFFGHINYYDLGTYIQQASVAVFPSVEDGYGMVINQALACGMPTIATANTGGPDVIRDNYNGFIIPACDATAIASKIQLLMADRTLLDHLHGNAHGSVKDGFTWNDYGKRYVERLKALSL